MTKFSNKLFLLIAFNLTLLGLNGQVFTEINKQPQGLANASAVWIISDGKLGLVHSGELVHSKMQPKTSFYKQTGQDQFTAANSSLPAVSRGDMDVADFNKDGLQDIVITGLGSNNKPVAGVFLQQSNGTFTRLPSNINGLIDGSVEFGDFDKDEDIDVLIAGSDNNKMISTRIYENVEGRLTESDISLPGLQFGTARWGDANRDGNLDILLTGLTSAGPVTRIYIYQNGAYKLLPQMFPGLKHSDGAWFDYNLDNKIDFVISGLNSSGLPYTRVFRAYKDLQFDEQRENGMRQLMNSKIDVSDFDADGDPDFIITGESLERPYTIVFENRKDVGFIDYMAGLTGVSNGMARWGDYDGDGDFDLFITGIDVCFNLIGNIYRNNLNPEIDRQEDEMDIFIESPIVDYSRGPYFYFVFSSCFCDIEGKGEKSYNMLISNIHKEKDDFNLTYKFNEILLDKFPGWPWSDRGHRTSNAFTSVKDAEEGRLQVIGGYTNDEFKIHYINW